MATLWGLLPTQGIPIQPSELGQTHEFRIAGVEIEYQSGKRSLRTPMGDCRAPSGLALTVEGGRNPLMLFAHRLINLRPSYRVAERDGLWYDGEVPGVCRAHSVAWSALE